MKNESMSTKMKDQENFPAEDAGDGQVQHKLNKTISSWFFEELFEPWQTFSS